MKINLQGKLHGAEIMKFNDFFRKVKEKIATYYENLNCA